MNRIDLEGRTAVVTGGASGLGLATAKRLLASGARVAVWDLDERDLAALPERLGGAGGTGGTSGAEAVQVDVSDFDSVTRAARATEERCGPVELLVNSAGITSRPTPITEFDLRDWDRVLSVNLTGVFHVCRALLPGMIDRGYGRVVNVASMAGKEGNPEETAYSAAKAGVIGLTKSLGREVARHGVCVNAVAPGIIESSMKTSQAGTDLVGGLLARTPMGRAGGVEEFAALVAWMLSDECSYSSGFTFDFSGGRATY